MIILQDRSITVEEPKTLVAVLHEWLATLDPTDQMKEHFLTILLNARLGVKLIDVVSIGTLNVALVHPREVFIRAIAAASASLIIAHNHPSGDCAPSAEDRSITTRLRDAGALIGVEVLDHIIIAADRYFSFKESGLI